MGSRPGGGCSFNPARPPVPLLESCRSTFSAGGLFIAHVPPSPRLRARFPVSGGLIGTVLAELMVFGTYTAGMSGSVPVALAVAAVSGSAEQPQPNRQSHMQ